NNAGATVGDDQFSGAGAHAFFTPGRDYTSSIDIGALESFDSFSIANDINDRFQVAGTSGATSGQRGFLYQRGVLRNVNVFPPANTTATGINNAGQIVGYADEEGGIFAFAVRIDPCHIPADATGSGEAPD
ncbi:hypothetical protein HN295_20315, partial [Acinetobacter baumannii]|uniref:hypothetical protein n=1 Tax=Acinetobacter baumannii TaxID=470 RepID=UPI0018E09D0C